MIDCWHRRTNVMITRNGLTDFLLQFDKSKDLKELYGMELHRIIDSQSTRPVRLKLCRNYFNGGFHHMSIDIHIILTFMKEWREETGSIYYSLGRGLFISTCGFNEIGSVFHYFY